jgi:hypothetical protein
VFVGGLDTGFCTAIPFGCTLVVSYGGFWVGIPLPCGVPRPLSASFVGVCIVTFWTIGWARFFASAIVNWRARIESALSISSYSNSSSSSVVS